MGGTFLDHGREEDLCDYGAEFAETGGESVACAADAGGEDFCGGYEGCGVGAWWEGGDG